jgi:hypothetical protein
MFQVVISKGIYRYEGINKPVIEYWQRYPIAQMPFFLYSPDKRRVRRSLEAQLLNRANPAIHDTLL